MMEASLQKSKISLKKVEIDFEGKKLNCKIQIIKEYLVISIDSLFKYKGYAHLSEIKNQISFGYCDINDIFEKINLLDKDNFSLIKENDKYYFIIKFEINSKEKDLIINLDENININLSKDELVTYILELKEIIKNKDEEVKILKDKLNKKTTKKNVFLNNFDIKLKQYPILKINIHKEEVRCLIMLKDGRIASGSYDNSIIIYNKRTYKPELIIKEHNRYISCLKELSSGILASCSWDNTIKLFNINRNNYYILQTLNYHNDDVYEIIELNNKQLASCSYDKSIIFYLKLNNRYTMNYKIDTSDFSNSLIQTKDNEICYSFYHNNPENDFCFFDILERKKIKTLNNIKGSKLLMITEDLLLIGGSEIFIINVNQYNIIRTIYAPSYIRTICMINENSIITGDNSGRIRQYKKEGDNLILIYDKEKAHNLPINSLLNLPNNHFASYSDDNTIKIW